MGFLARAGRRLESLRHAPCMEEAFILLIRERAGEG
jgi:hypothetical protein